MAFEFSISIVKQDLAALMGGLAAVKRDYQRKGVINNKLLSSLPHNSYITNIDNSSEKINLSSEKIANLISLALGEVEIQSAPDFETKVKTDSNHLFSVLVAKAIDNLIELYHKKFNQMQEKEREEFIQAQIEKEKNDNEKLKSLLQTLQDLENEKIKQELFIRMTILQAMKMQYAELLQREAALTVQLNQSMSEIVRKIFTTPDGKELLSKEQQNYIAEKVVEYKKQKFFEIREEFSKNPAYQNAQRYAPGNFVPENKKDLNAAVFNSLKWQAVNESGVVGIIKSACAELHLDLDEDVIDKNAKAIAEASKEEFEDVLSEMAEVRDAEIATKEEIINLESESENLSENVFENFNFFEDLDDENNEEVVPLAPGLSGIRRN